MTKQYDLLILGGGAAGFFAAIHAAENRPGMKVVILERSGEVLNKVRISGGGRCNVTHDCPKPEKLIGYYPRGHEFLLPCFQQFGVRETRNWFESHGVKLKTEADGRVFPKSDSSESIIQALTRRARQLGVEWVVSCGILEITKSADHRFILQNQQHRFTGDKLILATGGQPKMEQYQPYEALGLFCVSPCPSLFTFKLSPHPYKELLGLSVPKGKVKIEGTKIEQEGPILITHWGLSGPAVITSSAWQARLLHKKNYHFKIVISWTNLPEKELEQQLRTFACENPKKSLYSVSPIEIPLRLWKAMLHRLEIPEFRNWAECGKKTYARISNMLLHDQMSVSGKSTFKEEFVTAGGIELSQLSHDFEVKNQPGLFAIGELTNIDAVTGGFNFQAAWTAGYLAGRKAASR